MDVTQYNVHVQLYNIQYVGRSADAMGGGVPPLTTACAPPLLYTQITIFGTSRYCKTTKMVKGVITFKHNFPLKFS